VFFLQGILALKRAVQKEVAVLALVSISFALTAVVASQYGAEGAEDTSSITSDPQPSI